jgi:hypothetical protein
MTLKGEWTYDKRWDTWKFWRDSDRQNVIKIQRSKLHGLIPSRLHGSGITDEQLKKMVLPIQDALFDLSNMGTYSYEVSE